MAKKPENTAESNTSTIELIGLADARVPYFEQYFGLWAMHEEQFQALAHQLHGYDVRAHLLAVQTAQQANQQAVQMAGDAKPSRSFALSADGIAAIPIRGTLMKQQSSMSSATSTVVARRQIRAAVADDAVKAILLHVESPGGTVAGTEELALEVAAANAKKPVWSYIEDIGASAAYWIASQAGKVFANRMAMVGSIGTYGVVYDLSAMAAKEGIKVHVVRAGSYKGMFTPGTEVTSSQLAEYQHLVSQLNEAFLEGVSSGRKLPVEAVRALADGRVHLAHAAQGINLIDAVDTIDGMLNQLRQTISNPQSKSPGRSSKMSADNANTAANAAANQPIAATLEEIRAACPNANSDFVLAQLSNKATLAQATSAWMSHLSAENTRLAKANAEQDEQLKTKSATNTTAKANMPGVQPVHAGATASGGNASCEDPVAEFNALVNEGVKAGKSRPQAIKEAVANNPDLHQAMLAAYNAEHQPKRR